MLFRSLFPTHRLLTLNASKVAQGAIRGRQVQGLSQRSFSASFGDGHSCGDDDSEQLKKVQEYMKEHLRGTEPDLQDVLKKNKQWVKETNEKDPDLFPTIGAGQSPHYLYIGCADARVDPTLLMGLKYGDLFIHRNVGNVVSGTDLNAITVLEFAIGALKIPHIIVCGHYDCGAVRASSKPQDHGPIEYWLRNIRDVRRLYHDELQAISDPEERHRKLVELNVQEQCLNVLKTGVVQRTRIENYQNPDVNFAMPLVHGLVFDPANGLLKKLEIDTKNLGDVYDLYPQES